MVLRCLCILSALFLSGCFGGSEERYAVPDISSDDRLRISARTVEVIEVSLPTYAKSEEIWRETEGGALVSDPDTLWADDPVRGVTQELSRNLSNLTGARVAAQPWPFETPADARLDVRIEEMIAGADGRFRLAGQYFTASRTGGDQTGAFTLWAPIEEGSGPPGIALARASAIKELARQIAENGL